MSSEKKNKKREFGIRKRADSKLKVTTLSSYYLPYVQSRRIILSYRRFLRSI